MFFKDTVLAGKPFFIDSCHFINLYVFMRYPDPEESNFDCPGRRFIEQAYVAFLIH